VGTFPKTITVDLDLAENLPHIAGDKTQVHQALLNLCVNARDAMPDGGSLSIRTSVVQRESIADRYSDAIADCYAVVRVTDTGVGMDESTRQRIFEPFFTTKEIGRGTGLGLSVTYGVVVAHHGFADVESQIGKGSTFSLYFPCLPAGDGFDDREGLPAELAAGGDETILVVEDEPDLLGTLASLLTSKGYNVLTATDGSQAVDIFKRRIGDIDLLLTDIGLPKLDGWEAYKSIRAISPNTRVIFASGYFEPQKRAEMMQSGLRHFVDKPYHIEHILREIRLALAGEREAASTPD
jgi:CheY-like chemotaxis protein